MPDYFTKSVFLEGHGEPGSIRIVKMGPGMVWPTCTDCINTTSHESVLVAYNFGLATSCDLDFNAIVHFNSSKILSVGLFCCCMILKGVFVKK